MRFLMTPAALLLASLGMQQAQAQSAYEWVRPYLGWNGHNLNGCNLRVHRATHSGSLSRDSIVVTVRNGSVSAKHITAEVLYYGNNSIKSGTIAGVVQPGPRMASFQPFPPGGHTLDGTRLFVRFIGCRSA